MIGGRGVLPGGRHALRSTTRSESINVVLRVVDVELAGRCDQSLVLDHGFDLAGLVVDHNDGGWFDLVAGPYGIPDFVAALVVFALHDALDTFGFTEIGSCRDIDDFRLRIRLAEFGNPVHRDRTGQL